MESCRKLLTKSTTKWVLTCDEWWKERFYSAFFLMSFFFYFHISEFRMGGNVFKKKSKLSTTSFILSHYHSVSSSLNLFEWHIMGKFWELLFYPKLIYFVFNKCWFKVTPYCHPSSVTRECLGPISGWVFMALVLETWMNKSLSTRSHPLLNWLRSLTDLRHVDSPQRQ